MDVVAHIVEELAANAGVAYAGAVLRPHAFTMRNRGDVTENGRAVLDAARRAGFELAKDGQMRAETLEAVSRPLIAEEELRERYNRWG